MGAAREATYSPESRRKRPCRKIQSHHENLERLKKELTKKNGWRIAEQEARLPPQLVEEALENLVSDFVEGGLALWTVAGEGWTIYWAPDVDPSNLERSILQRLRFFRQA